MHRAPAGQRTLTHRSRRSSGIASIPSHSISWVEVYAMAQCYTLCYCTYLIGKERCLLFLLAVSFLIIITVVVVTIHLAIGM